MDRNPTGFAATSKAASAAHPVIAFVSAAFIWCGLLGFDTRHHRKEESANIGRLLEQDAPPYLVQLRFAASQG